MISATRLFLLALSARHYARGVAVPEAAKTRTVPPADLQALAPFTRFASAAYCHNDDIRTWSCGEACDALPGFQPTYVDGDGNAVQDYFVGYWPQRSAVIVAHQGTDPTQMLAILTDVDLIQSELSKDLFPGLPSDVRVHDGFRKEHEQSAIKVLKEVKRLVAAKNCRLVYTIGHSLGGALAMLDGLFLTLQLPRDVNIQTVVYGAPRVGNEAFADFVDKKLSNLKRINNKKDVVTVVPDRYHYYKHPQGEMHLVSPGLAFYCQGEDNDTDNECTNRFVPNVLLGNIVDHIGPYEGIDIGLCHVRSNMVGAVSIL